MLIYDIEIRSAILGRGEEPIEGVEYCDGWKDTVGMGVSCVCCYDYTEDRYRVFYEDNMQGFGLLVDSHDIIVGYNNIGFDNKVLAHVCRGTDSPEQNLEYLNEKSYDILAEIRAAGGGWCRLNDMVKVNGLASGKSDSGAMAPVYFQRGQVGRLTDYCIEDVRLTKLLLDKIIRGEPLISSRTGLEINIRKP